MKFLNKMGITKVTDKEYNIITNDLEICLDKTYVRYYDNFLDVSVEDDKVVFVAIYDKERIKNGLKVHYNIDIHEFNIFTNEESTIKVHRDNYNILIILKEVYNKMYEEIGNEKGVYTEILRKGMSYIMSEYQTKEFVGVNGYLTKDTIQIDGSTK